MWVVANDHLLWENLEDFVPKRFLDNERKLSMDLKGHDFELMPFGVGRRCCPGITLANLLYLFDWDLPNRMRKEDVDIEIFLGKVNHKKSPLVEHGSRNRPNGTRPNV
ncbi:hypothetical protein RD792_014392 [Penstemon davidsonii]|uniref:Cytochrome P450 n=1 Tax=Penstemon davidsonii TaxID=160366 RepID=A0ABR0CQV8_9LAMI|nr:hypothetical protein RD792_014392 [Penstemon davidsonii]